jgi:hypothetical protein
MEGNVPNFNRNLQTWLLGISSVAAVGAFTFLWNLNKNLATMQQDQMYGKQRYDQIQGTMNNVQLDLRDIRDKVIRLETKTDKK